MRCWAFVWERNEKRKPVPLNCVVDDKKNKTLSCRYGCLFKMQHNGEEPSARQQPGLQQQQEGQPDPPGRAPPALPLVEVDPPPPARANPSPHHHALPPEPPPAALLPQPHAVAEEPANENNNNNNNNENPNPVQEPAQQWRIFTIRRLPQRRPPERRLGVGGVEPIAAQAAAADPNPPIALEPPAAAGQGHGENHEQAPHVARAQRHPQQQQQQQDDGDDPSSSVVVVLPVSGPRPIPLRQALRIAQRILLRHEREQRGEGEGGDAQEPAQPAMPQPLEAPPQQAPQQDQNHQEPPQVMAPAVGRAVQPAQPVAAAAAAPPPGQEPERLARRIRRRLRREVPAIHPIGPRPGDGGGGGGNRVHRRVVNRAELCNSMVQHWWRRMRMESGGTVLNVGSCAGSSFPGRNPLWGGPYRPEVNPTTRTVHLSHSWVSALLRHVVALQKKKNKKKNNSNTSRLERMRPFHVRLERCSFSHGAAAQMANVLESIQPTICEFVGTSTNKKATKKQDRDTSTANSQGENQQQQRVNGADNHETNLDSANQLQQDRYIPSASTWNPYWHGLEHTTSAGSVTRRVIRIGRPEQAQLHPFDLVVQQGIARVNGQGPEDGGRMPQNDGLIDPENQLLLEWLTNRAPRVFYWPPPPGEALPQRRQQRHEQRQQLGQAIAQAFQNQQQAQAGAAAQGPVVLVAILAALEDEGYDNLTPEQLATIRTTLDPTNEHFPHVVLSAPTRNGIDQQPDAMSAVARMVSRVVRNRQQANPPNPVRAVPVAAHRPPEGHDQGPVPRADAQLQIPPVGNEENRMVEQPLAHAQVRGRVVAVRPGLDRAEVDSQQVFSPNGLSTDATSKNNIVFSHDTLVALFSALLSPPTSPGRRGLQVLRFHSLGFRQEGVVRLLCQVLRTHLTTLSTLCLTACRWKPRTMAQVIQALGQAQYDDMRGQPPYLSWKATPKEATLRHLYLNDSEWVDDAMIRSLCTTWKECYNSQLDGFRSLSPPQASPSTSMLAHVTTLCLVDNPLLTAVGVLPSLTLLLGTEQCPLEVLHISIGLRQPSNQEVRGESPTKAATKKKVSFAQPSQGAESRRNAGQDKVGNEDSSPEPMDEEEDDDDDDEDELVLASDASVLPVIDLSVRHRRIFDEFSVVLSKSKTVVRLTIDTPYSSRELQKPGGAQSTVASNVLTPPPDILVLVLHRGIKCATMKEMDLFHMIQWSRQKRPMTPTNSASTLSTSPDARNATLQPQLEESNVSQPFMTSSSSSLSINRLYHSENDNRCLLEGIARLSVVSWKFQNCKLSVAHEGGFVKSRTKKENILEDSGSADSPAFSHTIDTVMDDASSNWHQDQKPSAVPMLSSLANSCLFAKSGLKVLTLECVLEVPYSLLLPPDSCSISTLTIRNCLMTDSDLHHLLLVPNSEQSSGTSLSYATSNNNNKMLTEDTDPISTPSLVSSSLKAKGSSPEILNISHNALTALSLECLIAFVKVNHQLRELDVSYNHTLLQIDQHLTQDENNQVTDLQGRLVEAIHSHPRLESVRMVSCGISQASNAVLPGPLLRHFDKSEVLKSLDLGFITLERSFCGPSDRPVHQPSSECIPIGRKRGFHVYLDPLTIAETDLARYGEDLSSMSNVDSVFFYYMPLQLGISRLQSQLLSSVLVPALQLKELTLQFSHGRQLIETLMRTLVQGLGNNCSLKVLRLSNVTMPDTSREHLVTSLTSNTSPRLRVLGFRRVSLNLGSVLALLRHQTELNSFEMSASPLFRQTDVEQIETLSDTVAGLVALKNLILRECRMNGSVLSAILRGLEHRQVAVQKLDVAENPFANPGDWSWVSNISRLSKHLRHLTLNNNIWAREKWMDFVEQLQRNMYICSVKYHLRPCHDYLSTPSEPLRSITHHPNEDADSAGYRDIPDPLVTSIVRRNRYINMIQVMTGNETQLDKSYGQSVKHFNPDSWPSSLIPTILQKFGSENGDGTPLFLFLRAGAIPEGTTEGKQKRARFCNSYEIEISNGTAKKRLRRE